MKVLITAIESDEFYAQLAIANDIDNFIRFAWRNAFVRSLIENLQDSINGDAQIKVVSRMLNLLNDEYDDHYIRSADTALAVYLLALNAVNSPYAEPLANIILKTNNLWRAAQTAMVTQVGKRESTQTKKSLAKSVGQSADENTSQASVEMAAISLASFEVTESTDTRKVEPKETSTSTGFFARRGSEIFRFMAEDVAA